MSFHRCKYSLVRILSGVLTVMQHDVEHFSCQFHLSAVCDTRFLSVILPVCVGAGIRNHRFDWSGSCHGAVRISEPGDMYGEIGRASCRERV